MKDEATVQRANTLTTQCARGDRAAFGQLYALTVDACMGMAMSVLGSRTWAEDCVADTFVAVWKTAQNFAPERADAITWIMMICRSRALDRLRRERTHENYADIHLQWSDEIVSEPEPAQVFANFLAFGQLRNALQQLSEKQRRVIALTYFHGLTQSEIAQITGWPLGTIKSYVNRSLATLRNELNFDEKTLSTAS